MSRRDEIRQGLQQVNDRIERAAGDAGRDPAELTLVVITKYFPASDVALLAELGVGHVGENKDQEAATKVAELDPAVRDALTVHFVGQLQTNKARSVARYADVVHSVDRPRLARALDKAVANAVQAGERAGDLNLLLQIDLEQKERAGRGGVLPEDLPALVESVTAAERLRLRGVMAVAPPALDADGTRAAFDRLMECSRQVREEVPDAGWVSAGMSGDLELAVAAGATHLRVGSAILGSRPTSR
ncbi:YggS family pyridoxal phosphate-dependent enzyme [Ornithinicoccus halotolerans]|uniref:YggS family pyridoxal phosphate-dependent enzyme n=1 Tax=Ornithinicoccus halotolerans TaxID=1748220 RepID=UPI001296D3AD|nr:YggS family pyridoxal phosphate-dependent enzyme [Ornithinicoccus halotolerans]